MIVILATLLRIVTNDHRIIGDYRLATKVSTQTLTNVQNRVNKHQLLSISRKKTVYKRFNVHGNLDGNSDINLHGDIWERVTTFKYLEYAASKNTHKIQDDGMFMWKFKMAAKIKLYIKSRY